MKFLVILGALLFFDDATDSSVEPLTAPKPPQINIEDTEEILNTLGISANSDNDEPNKNGYARELQLSREKLERKRGVEVPIETQNAVSGAPGEHHPTHSYQLSSSGLNTEAKLPDSAPKAAKKGEEECGCIFEKWYIWAPPVTLLIFLTIAKALKKAS